MKTENLIADVAQTATMNTSPKNNTWLMEPLIPGGGAIIGIEVKPGTNTAYFNSALANGLANGVPELFSVYSCPKPRRVLYLNGTTSKQKINRHISSFNIGDNNNKNVKVYSPIEDMESTEYFSLYTEQGWSVLKPKREKDDESVIIYDNSISLFPTPADKNEMISEGTIWHKMKKLRKQGITQIIIMSGGRGGFYIPDDYFDLKLGLAREPDLTNITMKLNIMSSKEVLPPQPDSLTLDLVKDSNGNLSFVNREKEDELKVKIVWRAILGDTQTQIADKIDRDQSTISRWVKDLEVRNLIIREGGKVTALTDTGRTWFKDNGMNPNMVF